jgi:Zn-dependent peptidase ImmA (M78 family)/transcriptional regulator with XRE-family HTH domain
MFTQSTGNQPPAPNPAVIAWARHEGRFEVVRVAKRLAVKPEQIVAWEAGEKQPTVRQLMKLAQYYQRPLSLFFQPAPPRIPSLSSEHRRLPGVLPGEESPELRLAIRQMLTRREDALQLMGEFGEEIRDFRLAAHLREDPAEVGSRLRGAVGISIQDQIGWRDSWQAWREWRDALEGLGLLVFMFADVPMSEVRGIALLQYPLPVVAVNTKEVAEARPYTAAHEVVHLMLAAAKEETSALDDAHTPTQWQAIERFAESAASHAVLPEAALREAVAQRFEGAPQDLDGMQRLARRFKITPLAMATRLRGSGYLTWSEYQAWRTNWDAYVATLPKPGGFATPVSKTLGRGGRTFAQLVLDALDANRISSVDASRYLNLRFEYLGKLREQVARGAVGEVVDE